MKIGHTYRDCMRLGWMLAGLLWCSFTSAANYAGSNVITGVIVGDRGNILLLAEDWWQDAEGCNGWFDTIGMVVVPREHPGYSGLFALALSARAAPGERLQVYTQGCFLDSLYGFSMPRVQSATF